MNHKWIISRHVNDINLLIYVAQSIKKYQNNIDDNDKDKILDDLEKLKIYNPRYGKIKPSTLDSKINQLAFYMFGYKTRINGESRFLFSPLGNLFLKYKDNKNKNSKIFLTMLFGLQYKHPHSHTDKEFNLYPFRLIFKLLLDSRLEKKLFAYEVAYLVMTQKEMTHVLYENLILEILKIRILNVNEIETLFYKNHNRYMNASYEWDYYASKTLNTIDIFERTEGKVLFKMKHGNTETYRSITDNTISLSNNIVLYCEKLLNLYLFDREPLQNTDNKLQLDITKEIYNFYPQILLEEIGETTNYDILQVPKLISEFSKNKDNNTAYKFEDILVEGFNIFIDIEAQKIAGAGNTDIECLYLTENKKFAVEAKSTKNKLSLINDGRLQFHREKIGADYTIVITPGYVPAVLRDIKNTNSVIIKANTFSEFLYNSILEDERNINYEEIDNLIINNLGNDISDKISNITINKFAISKDSLI